MEYTLIITIYGGDTIELPVTWEVGIVQAKALTKHYEEKWTRHNSVVGPVRPTGQYHDLYNEGSIKLKPKNA